MLRAYAFVDPRQYASAVVVNGYIHLIESRLQITDKRGTHSK